MRRISIVMTMLCLLILVAACGRANAKLDEQSETIRAINEHNMQLQNELTRYQLEVAAYRQSHELLQELLAEQEEALELQLAHVVPGINPPFAGEITRNDVMASLIENIDAIAADIDRFIGSPLGDIVRESVLNHPEELIIRGSDVIIRYNVRPPVMLFYRTASLPFLEGEELPEFRSFEGIHYSIEWKTVIRNWGVAAFGESWYGVYWMHPVPSLAHPRQLTTQETVTIRFYMWDVAEETYYIEDIPGESLWEETIRLTRLHYGTQVRDLWFNDTILYVDLMPITGRLNVGWGNILFGMALRRTFEQFPGASEVRFLVGGQRPLPGSGYIGFDLNCVPPCPIWGTWGWENPPTDCICIW